ncbi:hypothetical protein ACIQWA_31195 [Kitasatospora sp. NPDC098652]|uniref:hypothetical protein n=1 Tax=Kitasatospora sp. NPDC098652 TaxID=3364095 RepID=UPI0038206B80
MRPIGTHGSGWRTIGLRLPGVWAFVTHGPRPRHPAGSDRAPICAGSGKLVVPEAERVRTETHIREALANIGEQHTLSRNADREDLDEHRELVRLAAASGISFSVIVKETGYGLSTVEKWARYRRRNAPTITDLASPLGALRLIGRRRKASATGGRNTAQRAARAAILGRLVGITSKEFAAATGYGPGTVEHWYAQQDWGTISPPRV